ncbi:hypothetical protein CYLTODRAFT_487608 [Cylindrobasidium torrendii FP15055 ss-10]|uniref:Uncharacterized protein n=1 Tax=Cylindrobasidium torrendii FP15055 ss-10 TaxID=1314674 RepID=A0A0D7BL63_9AGAR|nr:hypothetical protein CYLTODRAFT_487608 [Cylindrobasidium torrendii FP15055 ss-10]
MLSPVRKPDDVGSSLAQFARKVKDNITGYRPSIIDKTVAGPRRKLVAKSSTSPHSPSWRPHAGFRLRSTRKNPVHITDPVRAPSSTAESLGDQIAAAQARHSASIVQEHFSAPRKRKRECEAVNHPIHEDQTISAPVTGALNPSLKAGISLAPYATPLPTPTRPENVERLQKLKDVYHIITNHFSPIVPAVFQDIDVRVWRPTLAELDETLAQVAARYQEVVQASADKQEKLCKLMEVTQKTVEHANGEESPAKRRRLESQAEAREESILRTVQREAIEKDVRIADLQAQLRDSKAGCVRLRDQAKRKEAESLATAPSSDSAHHEHTQPQSDASAATDGSTTPARVSLFPGWTVPSGAQQATPSKRQPTPAPGNGLQTPAPSPPRSSSPRHVVSQTETEPLPSVAQRPPTNTMPSSTQLSPLQLPISFNFAGSDNAPAVPAFPINRFPPSTHVAQQQQVAFGSSESSSQLPSSSLQPSLIQPDIPAPSIMSTNSFPVAQDTTLMYQQTPFNASNAQQTPFQLDPNLQTGMGSPGNATAAQFLDTANNQPPFQAQPGNNLYAAGHGQTEHLIAQPFDYPPSQPTAHSQSSISTPSAQTNVFASQNAVTTASSLSLAGYGPAQPSRFAPVAQSNVFGSISTTDPSKRLAQACSAFGLPQPAAQAQVQSNPPPIPQLSSLSEWGQPVRAIGFNATAGPSVFGGAALASMPEATSMQSGRDNDISMDHDQPKMPSYRTSSQMQGKFAPASSGTSTKAVFSFKSSTDLLALARSRIPLNKDDFVQHPCAQEVIQAVLASNPGVRVDSLERLFKREYERLGEIRILSGIQALLRKNDYLFPKDCQRIFKKHGWL